MAALCKVSCVFLLGTLCYVLSESAYTDEQKLLKVDNGKILKELRAADEQKLERVREEPEETAQKLRVTDEQKAQNIFGIIIFELAKMMFKQSLSNKPASARAAAKLLNNFLKIQKARGLFSGCIEKKVLGIIYTALTDTVNELQQAREVIEGIPAEGVIGQQLHATAANASQALKILTAFKDGMGKETPGPVIVHTDEN